MRTKTMLLSALLGAIGCVSAMAQTNVYSQNAVGYVNVTVFPGFNIVTCPLLTSPDQTLNSILPNGTGTTHSYNGTTLTFYSPVTGATTTQGQTAGTGGTGWTLGASTNVIPPGEAFWYQNPASTNITLTFVGTVPSGLQTNVIVGGNSYNLIGSIVPMSGDLYSNTVCGTNGINGFTNVNNGDYVYVWNPTNTSPFVQIGYTGSTYKAVNPAIAHNGGSPWTITGYNGDPNIQQVGQGFFYVNNNANALNWVENFSVSQ